MMTIFNKSKDQMNRSLSDIETASKNNSLIRSVSSFNILQEGRKVWSNGKQAIDFFKKSISNSVNYEDSSSILRTSANFLSFLI